MNEVVGIDLGTTNSLVGTVVDGRVRLFPDAHGEVLLPSVVGTDERGGIVVGRAARNRRALDPNGTVVSIKRKMGTEVRVQVGTNALSPTEVSALLLGALIDRAEAALGSRPRRAIITVPAFFDDAQRQATRDAGEIAGLLVERLVNEPTAAAVAHQTGGEERVLVYDLGGGTFDVSVLERDEGFLEVRASRGDTQLGGDDVDRALAELVLERLGGSRSAVERDPRARVRLVEAVERAKIALSDRASVRVFDPFLAGTGDSAVHVDLELSRDDVDRVARRLVERTLRCIDDALRDARLRPTELDRILLVGGASKMPLVAAMIAEHLGRPAQLADEADLAVARGAALLAGRAAGADVNEVLVDVTPHTLSAGAVSIDDDDADDLTAVPIIPRNTVVPTERTHRLFTIHDRQRAVRIPIAQGEGAWIGDNTFLGELCVDELPPSPAHSPVDVVFKLDLSGVLHVSATHAPSGCAATTTIANAPSRLTAQRREQAMREVASLRARPNADEEQAFMTAKALAEAMLGRARKALGQTADAAPGAREQVALAIAGLEAALRARAADLEAKTDALSDALLDLV